MSEPAQQRDFVAALIHELMTPVSVLQGFAMTLEKSFDRLPPEVVRSAAGRIARSAAQLQSLVDALAQSRDIEIGSIDLERERTDLGEFVGQTVADLDTVTAGREVVLALDDGVAVDADPTRLRQVVSNLLSNAAKFAPAGTPVRVSVSAGAGQAEVRVQDQGPGIAKDDRERVFEKYARLDAGTKGLGLGLFISRGIARAHGGDLVIEGPDNHGSEKHGATFVLRLPQETGLA